MVRRFNNTAAIDRFKQWCKCLAPAPITADRAASAPGRSVHLLHLPMKSAPKPCNKPGCGVLVRDGSARCDKHKPPPWTKKPTATKRITGRKLQAMRTELLKAQPLCAECERQGRVRLATQRDHIKPLAEGGADDGDNVQGLCEPCHDAKSLQERLRALRRSRF